MSRINLAIARDAHRLFADTCKRPPVGRSMNDAATRILLWFCRQSDPVQSAVMSSVDRGMEHAYAAALRRLADDLERGDAGRPPDGDLAVELAPSQPVVGKIGLNGRPVVGDKEVSRKNAASRTTRKPL